MGRSATRWSPLVAIDNTGASFMVNPDLSPTIRALPNLASPKFAPFSLTVGQSLYVMDAFPADGRRLHRFEVLSKDPRSLRSKGWHWHPLDPPPDVYSNCETLDLSPNAYINGDRCHSIDSYTVVADSNIVVSNMASSLTYCFDMVKKTWNKAGDWALPFNSLAEYVPNQKLWFGISPAMDGYRFSGANLVASSDSDEMRLPDVHGSWKEYAEPPPEWCLAGSYSVHLGSSKFCIARFFQIGKIHVHPESHKSYKREEELQMVLTGVVVESCSKGPSVLKHKSERYKLDVSSNYQVI